MIFALIAHQNLAVINIIVNLIIELIHKQDIFIACFSKNHLTILSNMDYWIYRGLGLYLISHVLLYVLIWCFQLGLDLFTPRVFLFSIRRYIIPQTHVVSCFIILLILCFIDFFFEILSHTVVCRAAKFRCARHCMLFTRTNF